MGVDDTDVLGLSPNIVTEGALPCSAKIDDHQAIHSLGKHVQRMGNPSGARKKV